MTLLYNFSILLFQLAIRIAAFTGHVKAKQWVTGRKNIFNQIQNSLQPGEQRVWFHCASLGEFEQGRPVMEKLKIKNEKLKIVLTFFSPSGYEVRKNYAGADYVFYLPVDTKSNAERFISLINPEKVFFVKYEFWFHYLDTLHKKNIPVYLVSAIFRTQQKFFKWYGGFFRRMLKSVTHFFLQDDESAALLNSIGISNYTVTGDTRFDRVVEAAASVKPIPVIEKFKDGKELLIAGSTWKEDEEVILSSFTKLTLHPSPFKLIIAPHEINEPEIKRQLKIFSGFKTVRFSEAKEETVSAAQVLIIDNIGMLYSLYQYGTFAYVGGGFGKGIHNILEAAVFGIPVFFGPNYQKFREARDLINYSGAFSIQSSDELNSAIMTLANNEHKWKAASLVARNYVDDKKGAAEKIINYLMNK